jgi:hypothetical protein
VESAFRLVTMPTPVSFLAGGFEIGSTDMFAFPSSLHDLWINTDFSYNGSAIVSRSIELGEPVVYVSMNYRCVEYGPVLHS